MRTGKTVRVMWFEIFLNVPLAGLDIAKIWGSCWNPSIIQVTFVSKATNKGTEEPSHCYRSVLLYICKIWHVELNSQGMVSPSTWALAKSDIVKIWGVRLESKHNISDIFHPRPPMRVQKSLHTVTEVCYGMYGLTSWVGVLEYGITFNMSIDRVRHIQDLGGQAKSNTKHRIVDLYVQWHQWCYKGT